jgi:hypothetical protein
MSDKPEWLQKLAGFSIDNITVLLTIGFAGYIIYRREVAHPPVSTDDLLTAILWVLGLLATSEIVERYRRLGSIEKSVRRGLSLLESRFTDRPSAIAFFQKPHDVGSDVQSANQIDMCGVTLTSTVNKQFSNLRERLRKGARIRLLVIDPDSLAPKMSAQRRTGEGDVSYDFTRLEATLRDIEYLQKSWAEPRSQQGDSTEQGSLSVRFLPYAPSFGIISLDAGSSNGKVFVELYPHKAYRDQPAFDLMPYRDGEWYNFFVEQFEQMWQSGKPWAPGADLDVYGKLG